MLRGLEHLPCEDRLRELGGFSWRREGSGETLEQPPRTERGYRKDGEGLLIGGCRDRMRGNGFKLKEGRFR